MPRFITKTGHIQQVFSYMEISLLFYCIFLCFFAKRGFKKIIFFYMPNTISKKFRSLLYASASIFHFCGYGVHLKRGMPFEIFYYNCSKYFFNPLKLPRS